ncbi:hypothetical protein BJ138DRAFT_1096937 [Hygrophoropsis aurantiaca]|uniref:Uncharacterized protein n=1 Tax=Hygrophoropsis aurantiaca TaxID=72124 RepID=A0ACB8AT95_9AGAM|nr:hypothetical protein BJ138DRAFT_1096937 [Hygrophoropsis aurantiaca]
MTLPIIFYDIPSKLPNKAWSPNTWKTRFALNIKGVPYKTEWVELPDIEAIALTIGASPTGMRRNGNPFYTLPIIQDPNTGKVISDSFTIAEYLDATYPDRTTLFPAGTKALIAAFEDEVQRAREGMNFLQMTLTCSLLNAPSEDFFRESRERIFGKKLGELSPAGEKRDADLAMTKKKGFAILDNRLSKSHGRYVMDDIISFADVILGAWLLWIKNIQGADSAVWKDVASWNSGRWQARLKNLDKFIVVDTD